MALRVFLFALVCGVFVGKSLSAAPPGEKPVSFVRDIRPILARNCFACHGPDEKHREGELRLDLEAEAKAERDGRRPVAPPEPAASEVWKRITAADPDVRMPPPASGRALSAEQLDLIRRWIEQGAVWQSHWAFEKPVRPAPPEVRQQDWPRSDLDRFVLARLEQEGLTPAPTADRHTLARRVALDLTGLPPDAAILERYLADDSPGAYARLVDELLNSPAYGERWARLWLDLARYADTKGYEKDLGRTMWRYRDWVIDAFNADLPYDQFTREQLAGDLLPDATTDQLLATAFHRNTMVNDEGGTDNEEFRVAAVKDRVDTTIQVWMGLTMGCAKCHSHKYDPLTNREYYQFYAFFNQTEDADDFDERPKLATPTAEQRARQAELQQQIAAVQQRLQTFSPEFQAAAGKWAEEQRSRRHWIALAPLEFQAASGSTLTKEGEHTLLAEAKQPAQETYTVTLRLPDDLQRITGLRLEALPDKSHPRGGVGRSTGDGNFVLSQIRATLRTAAGEAALPFEKALADFSQDNYPVEHALRNANLKKHGWAVSPQQTKPHTAVFLPAQPVAVEGAATLIVTLDHQFEFSYPGFSLGKFRLSITSDVQPGLEDGLPAAVLAVVRTPAEQRTAAQLQTLWKHYATVAPLMKPARDELESLQQQLAALPIPQTPILRELPADKRRPNRMHVRGNFLDPGEEVEPAVPATFHPFDEKLPKNRLGVAEWLMHPDNPLTARVAVNRAWAQFFGRGLVETQEDFGSQGTPPTHPELLDWLAVEFREQGWSWKRLCRTIVLSATYRQSSRAAPELLERDRDNRLLARGPRFRLEAEMIRDASLAASGLLSRKLHGPSVMPPQPPGIWQSTYNTAKWETSPGEDRYRRGLYTFVKRTSPYPAMTTFDAPSRELCTVRRISTNTPLQALVTLNDAAFVEMAQALARRMVREGGRTAAERLARGLEWALVRPPRPQEVAALQALYESRLVYYREHPDDAQKLATEPLGPLPEGWSPAELAALTAAANVVLNLDEFLTRN